MAPLIDNEFVCIVDREDFVLAAVVSSYLTKPNKYLPYFVFPYVETGPYDVDIKDENYVMVSRAREFKIRIRNALAALNGCKYLVLVGINDKQKSYLNFINGYKVLEIQEITDVDKVLKPLVKKTEYLYCREEQVFIGSYLASKNNKLLQIESNAANLELATAGSKGLICMENRNNSNTLVGINYALSISADVNFIEVPDVDEKEIDRELAEWDETGDRTRLNNVGALVFPSVQHINFSLYAFATFFTGGIPYPLVLQNVIPFTCVHNGLHPDFFVFNNLYYELSKNLPSAIVFSPLEFGTDEETLHVIKKLEENNYYVHRLIDEDASTTNIEYSVRDFPFGVLHICSHGGEVEGYERELKFKDRDSNEHTIEFDEVVSFSGGRPDQLIQVTSKWYFRKFNGLIWRSKELRDKNYPHYVFSDMTAALHDDKTRARKRIRKVNGSAAIKCKNFNYFAEFNMIAGWHYSPFIFNNTCWSCSEISHSFLSVGARGYIGTLWSVENAVARQVAETFYNNAFGMTALDALKIGLEHTKGTDNENIYLFWGLHFSKITPGSSVAESRAIVAKKIDSSIRLLKKNIAAVTNQQTKENLKAIIQWNFSLLVDSFLPEAIRMGCIGVRRQ